MMAQNWPASSSRPSRLIAISKLWIVDCNSSFLLLGKVKLSTFGKSGDQLGSLVDFRAVSEVAGSMSRRGRSEE